jgi:hypothetical protein
MTKIVVGEGIGQMVTPMVAYPLVKKTCSGRERIHYIEMHRISLF